MAAFGIIPITDMASPEHIDALAQSKPIPANDVEGT